MGRGGGNARQTRCKVLGWPRRLGRARPVSGTVHSEGLFLDCSKPAGGWRLGWVSLSQPRWVLDFAGPPPSPRAFQRAAGGRWRGPHPPQRRAGPCGPNWSVARVVAGWQEGSPVTLPSGRRGAQPWWASGRPGCNLCVIVRVWASSCYQVRAGVPGGQTDIEGDAFDCRREGKGESATVAHNTL